MPNLRLLAAATFVAYACIGGSAFAAEVSDRFCVIPVKNGAPTAADRGDTYRLAYKVVMLPGVARPIIYAFNRHGVWTINEEREFVPFGGNFPAGVGGIVYDHFVGDSATGGTFGINASFGLYRIDPGETAFRQIAAANRNPRIPSALRRPHGMIFVPRFGALVISDGKALLLADRDGNVTPLPVREPDRLGTPGATFDLPALGALLISTTPSAPRSTTTFGERLASWMSPRQQPAEELLLRWDDGELESLITLERGDFVRDADITPDGLAIEIRTQRIPSLRLPVPQKAGQPSQSLPAGKRQRLEIQEVRLGYRKAENVPLPLRLGRFANQVAAPSVSKSYLWGEMGAMFARETGNRFTPIPIPQDYSFSYRRGKDRVEEVQELPASKAVFVFTSTHVFAVDANNVVTEVPGGNEVGSYRGHFKGIIPVRNEMIIAGRQSLYLLIDRTFSGDQACGS